MNTKEAILSRRSIRKFLDTPIPKEMIDALLEAGYNAPSACNRKPVDFYVITSADKLAEINACGRFTNMPSPLVIVVAGNLKRALPRSFCEYWIQDASAACQNILLMATELGLGACWNGAYPQKDVARAVSEIIGADENTVPLAIIRIGYPAQEAEAHFGYDKSVVTFIE
jgi:nitroreductase